jgi:hypothetical protein
MVCLHGFPYQNVDAFLVSCMYSCLLFVTAFFILHFIHRLFDDFLKRLKKSLRLEESILIRPHVQRRDAYSLVFLRLKN